MTLYAFERADIDSTWVYFLFYRENPLFSLISTQLVRLCLHQANQVGIDSFMPPALLRLLVNNEPSIFRPKRRSFNGIIKFFNSFDCGCKAFVHLSRHKTLLLRRFRLLQLLLLQLEFLLAMKFSRADELPLVDDFGTEPAEVLNIVSALIVYKLYAVYAN